MRTLENVTSRAHIAAFATGAALFAAAFWFVAVSLTRQWLDDPNYTHGLFVVPMAALLAWRRRERLMAVPATPDIRGLLVMAAALVLYAIGIAAAELFTMRVSMIVMFWGLTLAWQGWNRTRAILFPLMFLLLMVPLPYVFYFKATFPLQLVSSRLAGFALGTMGMPVLRSGNVLHLEHYTLEVVTACSGLRSMMTLGTIAIFLSDFMRTRRAGQVLLIALSVPVAVFSNTVRLIATAVISAIAGAETAEGFLHGLSGVIVFVTGLIILLVCGRVLEWLFPKSR